MVFARCLALLAAAEACSNFMMPNNFLSVRTMDLGGQAFGFNVLAVPQGAVAKNELAYLSFNPAEGAVDLARLSTGGMNSRGLSCDMQTLVGSEYPKGSNSFSNVRANLASYGVFSTSFT